jgi:hypothetical protein
MSAAVPSQGVLDFLTDEFPEFVAATWPNNWPGARAANEQAVQSERPNLYTTPYKRVKAYGKRLQGFRLDFKLAKPAYGTIYQTVESTLTVGDSSESFSFTEAWRVRPRRPRRKMIDQNGTDSFLVPGDEVNEADGQLDVVATAWFEPGELDEEFEQGKDEQLWGRLYGHNLLRPVPEGAKTVQRHTILRWKKGGPVELTQQAYDV